VAIRMTWTALPMRILAGIGFTLFLVGCQCRVDYRAKADFPRSDWTIYTIGHDCSAISGDFEVTAVNRRTGAKLLLFHIDGDFSGRVLIERDGVLLLVNKAAEISQSAHHFGPYSVHYRRATAKDLKDPSRSH
jgi:hypothetical protein